MFEFCNWLELLKLSPHSISRNALPVHNSLELKNKLFCSIFNKSFDDFSLIFLLF